jgi:DNA-binding transcriptional MerR regulator
VRDLDIAEVARHAGVTASTLRYYEERGLIASIGRRGLKRLFDPRVVDQLALIALGRTAGFSLDETAAMLPAAPSTGIDRERLNAKADDLDRMIRRLAAMRDGLRHAAACPESDQLQCPKFRRLMALAQRGGRAAGQHGGRAAR